MSITISMTTAIPMSKTKTITMSSANDFIKIYQKTFKRNNNENNKHIYCIE